MPQLVFVTGTSAGLSVELDRGLTLGRTDGDVLVTDSRVSRRHAAVRIEGGRAIVEDLGSANGTWVNEERLLGSRVLSPGDRIRVGDTSFEIRFDQLTVPSADVAAPPLAVSAVEPSPAVPFGALAASTVEPRRSAQSRRIGPLVFSVAATVATAIALVVYFAVRS